MTDEFVIQPSGGDIPEVPDSLYTATIVDVVPVKLETPDQFGKVNKVDISVEFNVDGEVVRIDPRVNQSWSEKATLFVIAQASGLDPNPTVAFHPRDLIGRQVNILTEQEEGKWPRVKAWSRVPQKKAASKPPEPSAFAGVTVSPPMPSIVNSDGSANYDAFWRGVKALGLNRVHVANKLNGDVDNLQLMDGPDVAFLLEEMKLQVEAAV